MKPATRTAARLLGALEDFAKREALLLRAGDFAGFAAIRRRETPLIVRLCEIGPGADGMALAGRLEALLAMRRENLSMLQQRRTFLGSERERVASTRERLRIVSPYGRSSPFSNPQVAARFRANRLNAAV